MFTKTKPDGSKEQISEAQVTEEILQYLRSQTQLVIGHAVVAKDLRSFLKTNGIDPWLRNPEPGFPADRKMPRPLKSDVICTNTMTELTATEKENTFLKKVVVVKRISYASFIVFVLCIIGLPSMAIRFISIIFLIAPVFVMLVIYCPRCGKRFFVKSWFGRPNPFISGCSHCGLSTKQIGHENNNKIYR